MARETRAIPKTYCIVPSGRWLFCESLRRTDNRLATDPEHIKISGTAAIASATSRRSCFTGCLRRAFGANRHDAIIFRIE